MIAYIAGKLTYKDPIQVIIDIGGLGYEVKISLNTFSQVKNQDTCKLFTYLHIKEDAHTLYGFASLEEKRWFLALIRINGIGTGIAMTTLSSLNPNELQQAIVHEDVALIKSIKGIGDKAAHRIILELKDKLGKIATTDSSLPYSNVKESLRQEALIALTTLGIHKNVGEKAISTILQKYQGDISLEELIKLALKAS